MQSVNNPLGKVPEGEHWEVVVINSNLKEAKGKKSVLEFDAGEKIILEKVQSYDNSPSKVPE